jgi:hypothetical protein
VALQVRAMWLSQSAPVDLKLRAGGSIWARFATLLLQSSAKEKIGFWCIEKIGEKHIYSVMHNAEMQLINNTYFEKVVRKLISECDKFEEVLVRVFSSSN